MFIALFFFVVNIATLEQLTEADPGLRLQAFQMATAILLGVTGVSRAPALVLDVQDGYFDRLLLTPVGAPRSCSATWPPTSPWPPALTLPIIVLGLILGVRFEGGPLGMVVFIGAGRAVEPGLRRVRLRHRPQDRQPGGGELELPAVLPVPVPHVVVRAARASSPGWLDTVAAFNPVTYLLDGLRSLVLAEGWQWDDLGEALLAIAIVGAVSMTMCFAALRGGWRGADHPPHAPHAALIWRGHRPHQGRRRRPRRRETGAHMTDDDTPAGEPATGPAGRTRDPSAPRVHAGPRSARSSWRRSPPSPRSPPGRSWRRRAGRRPPMPPMSPVPAPPAPAQASSARGRHRATMPPVRPGEITRTRARHRHDPLPPYEQRYADATDDRAPGRRRAAGVGAVGARPLRGRGRRRRRRLPSAPRRPRGPTVHYVDQVGRPGGARPRPRPAERPRLRHRSRRRAGAAGGVLRRATRDAGTVAGGRSRRVAQPRSDLPGVLRHRRRALHRQPAACSTCGPPTRSSSPAGATSRVEVEVVDPFGAPFRASVARAG